MNLDILFNRMVYKLFVFAISGVKLAEWVVVYNLTYSLHEKASLPRFDTLGYGSLERN